jgi:mitogen-activated protein kinase organizer 1
MNLHSVLAGHTGPVNAVRWTKDGNYCLSASDDRTVKLWNPHKICPPSSSAVAAAADTKTAAVGQAPQIKSYGGAHGYAIQDVAVFHDNTRFVSGGKDRTLFVWDVTSGAVIRRIAAHDNVNALALNALSTVVLSASYDQTVRIWDLRSQGRQAIQTLNDFRDSVTSVSITGHTVRAPSVCVRVCCVCMWLPPAKHSW